MQILLPFRSLLISLVWFLTLVFFSGSSVLVLNHCSSKGSVANPSPIVPVTPPGPPSTLSTTLPRTLPAQLEDLEHRTFNFFWNTTDSTTGLVPDRWPSHTFSSVASIGFGLSAYIIGSERGYVTRTQAAQRVFATLSYLYKLKQSNATGGIGGYKGFFYHFLNYSDGTRFQDVELSNIDTALLLAGALSCEQYFTWTGTTETQIRALADTIYRRVDWTFLNSGNGVQYMGWHPENGGTFIQSKWVGYNEAMLLYVLALGSPTYPISASGWNGWTAGYEWNTFYNQTNVQFGPLFGHQYSHCWIDFRGIQDAYMRNKGIDYYENSRRATISQKAYAAANPGHWAGYGANDWGLTACDGPGVTYKGINYAGYNARGAASNYSTDDGTIAPTAAGSSIVFLPDESIAALKQMCTERNGSLLGTYGLFDSYNPSYTANSTNGWVDKDYLGIDQGPMLIMMENYHSELIWNLMKTNPYFKTGLKNAGFTGGWLN